MSSFDGKSAIQSITDVTASTDNYVRTDFGIRVFSYGSDVAYFAKRRYLLGLAEESMKMRSPEYSFLGWKDMEKLN